MNAKKHEKNFTKFAGKKILTWAIIFGWFKDFQQVEVKLKISCDWRDQHLFIFHHVLEVFYLSFGLILLSSQSLRLVIGYLK